MTAAVNTLEHPSEFDALVKLRPNEPYFLLIGRDRLAPALVLGWAKANRTRALDEHDAGTIAQDRLDHELRQSTQAEQIAWAMQAYKAGHAAAAPPEASTAPTYTGHHLPEETLARDLRQSALTNAGQRISNAVAELIEAATIASEYGLSEQCIKLASLADRARAIEPAITPQRPLPQ